jgi:mannose-6-phosphate isomerase
MSAHISSRFFLQPIPLQPHFSERPWGGTALRDVLGKRLPTGAGPIGESWELSDHPDGRSTVDGIPFGELLRSFPKQLLGRDQAPAKYPILVKYIDAQGDLSVQVHPDNAWCLAHQHNDLGKSECWYVMDCAPGTKVVYGYLPGTTEAQVREAIAAGTLESLLYYHPIEPGDFLTIPPGCVHAMLAGTLVCEIQQSSNTTFRIYDWNRQPPRALHIKEAMQVSQFDSRKLPPIQQLGVDTSAINQRPDILLPLLNNEFFSVDLYQLSPSCSVSNAPVLAPSGRIINVVAGSGTMAGNGWHVRLERGSTWFLPASMQQLPGLQADADGLRLLLTTSHEV